MSAPQVAITGLGCVSALGPDAASTWAAMREGRCGVGPLSAVPYLDDLKIKVGGEIIGETAEWIPRRQKSTMDRFSVLAVEAARQAIEQSGLEIDNELSERTGCIIGVGVAGWHIIEESYRKVLLEGASRTNVMAVPKIMPSAPASQVSLMNNIKGPVFGATSACSSSNHAIALGMDMIQSGRADAVIVGGTDAPLIFGILKGWEALRVVSAEPCRPFSLNRSGLSLADGAGVAVLENMDTARARGADVLAELAGCGMTGDAESLVLPTVEGPARAIQQCLAQARLTPEDVDYINAHGTGTAANDMTETQIIRQVFGTHADSLNVSSTKSMHGHSLGGSGGIELMACVNALREGIVPPTVNYDAADPECDLNVTPNEAQERKMDVALSNSFAFGGTNAVVAVRKV